MASGDNPFDAPYGDGETEYERSLRGNPVEMLERSAHLTYFPMLWAVRDRMFIDFRAGPLET